MITLIVPYSNRSQKRFPEAALDLGYTIPAVLANEFPEAVDDLHIGALMYLALILFTVTLLVNTIAVLLVRLLNRHKLLTLLWLKAKRILAVI